MTDRDRLRRVLEQLNDLSFWIQTVLHKTDPTCERCHLDQLTSSRATGNVTETHTRKDTP